METKEHDIFMEMLDNQQADLNTIITAGLNPTNTFIHDKSVYKKDKWVLDVFTNSEGEFDNNSFNKAYDLALLYYNDLANTSYELAMKELATYHRDNIYAPVDLLRTGPEFVKTTISNPYEQIHGLITLGKTEGPTKSVDELSLTKKVLVNPTTAGDNLENAVWDEAPNDKFWGYFLDTLVLALYDTDGTHKDPISGELVLHNKGDLKLNEDGDFYYEKLDGRDIYGRKVLNKMNVLTTDGSKWNKYDFFDSDDLELKSIGGTTLKNLALVGTMFLPYAGPWVTALSLGTLLVGMGATLGKMLVGSDSPTLSALEGWAESLNRQNAKTQYAQDNLWCWENFINLIGDVMGLVRELRFIFEKVPQLIKGIDITTDAGKAIKLKEFLEARTAFAETKIKDLLKSTKDLNLILKKTAELYTIAKSAANADLNAFVKSYYNLGHVFGRSYMTALVASDTYGEAKLAGASDLDATLLTLGHMAGEYALLSTDIGSWAFPEVRAARQRNKAVILAALKNKNESVTDLYKLFGSTLKNMPKEGKKEYVKNLFNIGKNIANASYVTGQKTLASALGAGAAEGIEEVSEEFLADFSKGCYDVVKWLQGEDTRINTLGYNFQENTWDASNIIDRYGMSLLGGAIGGGLSNIATDYKAIKSYENMSNEQAILEIIYMHRNGEIKDFLKELDKTTLGDKNLSATEYEDLDGTLIPKQGTKDNNQDLLLKLAVKNQVKLIGEILEANGVNISDDSFLDIQTLKDLRFNALHRSSTAGLYLNEFNTLSSDLFKLIEARNQYYNSISDTNQDGTVNDKENRRKELSDTEEKHLKKLDEEIKETLKKLEELISGKRSYEFVLTALFELIENLSGLFTTPSFPMYAEAHFGKKYAELTDNLKTEALEKYKVWKTTEGREKMQKLSTIFSKISGLASNIITEHSKKYLSTPEEISKLERLISTLYRTAGDSDPLFTLEGIQLDEQYLLDFITLFDKDSIPYVQALANNLTELLPTLTPEELTFHINKFKHNLGTILFNNIRSYLDPIIKRGFANTEVKENLNKTLNVLENIALEELGKASLEADESEDFFNTDLDDKVVYWTTKVNNIKQLKTEINNLKNTPIEENLNEFSISIGNAPINITSLLERLNTFFNSTSDNISAFQIEKQLYNDVENALFTLLMYKAAILGARTDAVGLTDYYGYNATLNEISSKLKLDKPKLAEIDSNVADILILDIDPLINKLNYLKKLHNINKNAKLSKLDRVDVNKNILVYKELTHLFNVDDDEVKDWEGIQELVLVLKNAKLHLELAETKNRVLNKLQRKDLESEKLKIEDAIYDFFLTNSSKLQNVEVLSKLLNPKRLALYTKANNLLTEDLEALDSNSILWWVATRAAVKASSFYNQFRLIIDLKAERPLAPIPTLEIAVYTNYASIVNGNVFSLFYKATRLAIIKDWENKDIKDRKNILKLLGKDESIADKNKDKWALNFLPVPRYINTTFTEGIPGSGKTTAVYKQTIKLLEKFHPDSHILSNLAIVHGASQIGADNIKTDLGIKTSTAYTKDKFMLEIDAGLREYEIDPDTNNYLVPKEDYIITSESEIRAKTHLKETDNPFSLIIIDEVSKFTAYELDKIDAYAQKYGITVLVSGDFDLTGVKGLHSITLDGESYTWTVNLDRTNFIRSPKLGVSMRTDNSVKTLNQTKILAYIINEDYNLDLDLNYFEDETGLYGDKVLLYSPEDKAASTSDVLKEIDKLIKTSKEPIGYIYKDKNSPIYKELSSSKYKDKINLKEGGSALGLEGLYYIIEADYKDGEDKENWLKDLYTGVTRSELGSIIIAPVGKLSSQPVSEKIEDTYSKEAILRYSKLRKDLLDSLFGSLPNVLYVPRDKGFTVVEVDPEKSHELSEGTVSFPSGPTATPPVEPVTTSAGSTTATPPAGPSTPPSTPPSGPVTTPPATTEPSVLPVEEVPVNPYNNILNPITTKDVTDEDTFKETLLLDMLGEEPIPDILDNEDIISFEMLLHTFNTFELGVLFSETESGEYILDELWLKTEKDRLKYRKDSIHGLWNLDRTLGKTPTKELDKYIQQLGRLRSIIFNTKNKQEIIEKISSYLKSVNDNNSYFDTNEFYITFALKATAKNRNLEGFVGNETSGFTKDNLESILFNGSTDTNSSIWQEKSIVAIFGNTKTGDIIELPLLCLSSPYTLIKSKNSDGKYPFQEILDFYNRNIKEKIDLYKGAKLIIELFGNNSKYKNIVDLFRLFTITDNTIKYIEDDDWTLAKNLSLVGPLVSTNKGRHQDLPGFEYNNKDFEWKTVEEIAKNPQCRITSILNSIDGNIYDKEGNGKLVVLPGHPFVLISYDTELNTDDKIVSYYIRLQLDSTLPAKVALTYLLPPKASFLEYIENVHNIITLNTSEVKPIGLLFTSYKILNILLQNPGFLKKLQERLSPALLKKVLETVEGLNKLEDNIEIANKLLEVLDWTEYNIGTSKTVLAGLFDGVLYNMAYTINTINNNIGLSNISQLDPDTVHLMQTILSAKGKSIYYDARIPKKGLQKIGPFYLILLEENWKINGKSFQIPAKIDSYTFIGDTSEIVSSFLNNLEEITTKSGLKHIISKDSESYRRNKSQLQKKELDLKELNRLNYLKNKLGNVENLNSMTNRGVIDYINNNGIQRIAFTIGEDLKISNEVTNISFPIFMLNSEGNPITDIKNTVDNNGVYSFLLIDSNGVIYNAQYDTSGLSLTPLSSSDNQVFPLTITEANFSDYIERGKALSEKIDDIDILNLFNSESYEDFMNYLGNEYDNIGDSRIEDLEELKNTLDNEEEIALINELIQLENYENTESCPITIKITF